MERTSFAREPSTGSTRARIVGDCANRLTLSIFLARPRTPADEEENDSSISRNISRRRDSSTIPETIENPSRRILLTTVEVIGSDVDIIIKVRWSKQAQYILTPDAIRIECPDISLHCPSHRCTREA